MANFFSNLINFGRKPQKRSPSLQKEAGVSGATVIGGYLQTREKNAALQGTKKFLRYEEILSNITIVAAGARSFVNLGAKARWSVNASEADTDNWHADFVEDLLNNSESSWSKIVRQSLMFRFYGFSVQEWTAYKRDDGHLSLKSLESRPQHTIEQWDLRDDGAVKGFVQYAPVSGEALYIPREKVVYLCDDTVNDSPEGLGLLRHVVDPATRREIYQDIEQRGFDKDLRGIPLGRAPLAQLDQAVKDGTITTAQRDAQLTALANLVQIEKTTNKTALILDSQPFVSRSDTGESVTGTPQWDLQLIQSNSMALSEMAHALTRLDTEMARVIGTDGQMLDGAGSNALAKDKSQNLMMQVNSALEDLRHCYQADLISRFWQLNGFDPAMKPSLSVEEISQRSIDEVTAVLRDMASAGAVILPDDPVVNAVRSKIGLPEQLETAPEIEV